MPNNAIRSIPDHQCPLLTTSVHDDADDEDDYDYMIMMMMMVMMLTTTSTMTVLMSMMMVMMMMKKKNMLMIRSTMTIRPMSCQRFSIALLTAMKLDRA